MPTGVVLSHVISGNDEWLTVRLAEGGGTTDYLAIIPRAYLRRLTPDGRRSRWRRELQEVRLRALRSANPPAPPTPETTLSGDFAF